MAVVVVAANGARGALIAMVRRKDMSFAGFWKWYSCCCRCFGWVLDRWGVVSWVVVFGGEMMSMGIRMVALDRHRRHSGVASCSLVRVGIAENPLPGWV